jgi:hypothetical protein
MRPQLLQYCGPSRWHWPVTNQTFDMKSPIILRLSSQPPLWRRAAVDLAICKIAGASDHRIVCSGERPGAFSSCRLGLSLTMLDSTRIETIKETLVETRLLRDNPECRAPSSFGRDRC